MAVANTASKVAKAAATGGKGRLVLCFDGTGNDFAGDTSDTNIVKLYKMFKRDDDRQWHYYQPGIGTYTAGTDKVNVGPIGQFQRSWSQTLDQGFGSSFDEHVIAGYKFLMRYYDTNDQIYIFGFSRGAFTARFLARMISEIGLLSRGNEEMIPFAFSEYQAFEAGVSKRADPEKWFTEFASTFCRTGVRAHFLGLFDTVRSVSTFDSPFSRPAQIPAFNSYARHVRHAVSLDECRAKFKPALLRDDPDKEDIPKPDPPVEKDGKSKKVKHAENESKLKEDVKEVWFPGNHGDIGGGWPIPKVTPEDKRSPWWWPFGAKNIDVKTKKYVQLSSRPLEWMIQEIEALPAENEEDRIKFNERKDAFLKKFEERRLLAYSSKIHSVLRFGKDRDVSWMKVLLWNFMEYLPFGRNTLNQQKTKWIRTNTPNMGARRPLPKNGEGVVLDHSVMKRMDLDKTYLRDAHGQVFKEVSLALKGC